MAGLAAIVQQQGKTVRGSDVAQTFATAEPLRRLGVTVHRGFAVAHLDPPPGLVVVGASWRETHPEVRAARERGIPVVPESELRGWLSRQKKTIVVSGVHGKSTTTALLAWVLTHAGRDPSYLVGAPAVAGLPASGRWGGGEYFVVEGDEYAKSQTDRTAKFLDLDPWATVITSVEWEHVDVYPNVGAMEAAFAKLAKKTRGPVVVGADWPSAIKAASAARHIISYGVGGNADYQVVDFQPTRAGSEFAVRYRGREYCRLFSPLIGRHNAVNAAAAMIVAQAAGVRRTQFTEALRSFQGLARRQHVQVRDGVTWIDDYGHHPTEISRTLEAIRERYPKEKIWVVFQPHLASRTRALMAQFATSFTPANRVVIAGLFASAREPNDPQAANDLAAAIAASHPAVRFGGSLAQTAAYLAPHLEPGDVVITMGAGDVDNVRSLVWETPRKSGRGQ